MKCQEVYHLIQAYLDVAVTPEQERLVEAHVRACPKCRRRLVRLAQATNRLEDGDKARVGNDFTVRLFARLKAGELGEVGDPPGVQDKPKPHQHDRKLR